MSHRLRNAYLSGQSRGISLCACADGVKSTSLQVRNSLDTGARVVLTSETAVGYMHVTCATCAKMKSSCGGLFWEKRALLGKHCFRIWKNNTCIILSIALCINKQKVSRNTLPVTLCSIDYENTPTWPLSAREVGTGVRIPHINSDILNRVGNEIPLFVKRFLSVCFFGSQQYDPPKWFTKCMVFCFTIQHSQLTLCSCSALLSILAHSSISELNFWYCQWQETTRYLCTKTLLLVLAHCEPAWNPIHQTVTSFYLQT